MISKNKILNFFIISFLTAILVNNYLQDFLLSLIFFTGLSLVFLNFVIYKNKRSKYIYLYIFLLIGFVFGVFISKSNIDKININSLILEKYYLTNNNYEFEVKDIYKRDDFYDSYIVKLNKVTGIIVDKNIYGIVYVANNNKLEKGYTISTKSQILNIDNVDNFDYKNYLLTKSIYFKTYIFNYEVVNEKKDFLSKLEKFRTSILGKINKVFPYEEAILLSGILIGARENIPKDLNKDFNNSGTTHFIAVSGANITILIVFLGFLLKFIPIYIRTLIIVTFVIIFCFFVGLDASVVRAGIMGILGYLIMVSGRNTVSITMLLIASFLMVLYRPFYINYDVSFHLSFLAVLGILYLKGFFDKVFGFIPNLLAIRESFSITMAALTFTFPIIFLNFGQISLLTPFSNIAFAWTIPLIMLTGFLSIIGSFINSFLGIVVGFPAFIFLKWDIVVVHFFGNLDSFLLKSNFLDYAVYFEITYFVILFYLITFCKLKKYPEKISG